jgi:hypothetical protein
MNDAHRIRLQAAWDVDAGGTTWTRSFGRPTGVGPGDRIWLVIERPADCAATLNGLPLPPVSAGASVWRADVTTSLRDRNELRLVLGSARLARDGRARVPLPDAVGRVAIEVDAES